MIWKLHMCIPAKLGSARLAYSRSHKVTAADPIMVGTATIFVVTGVAKSSERYREVLGFTWCGGHGESGAKRIRRNAEVCAMTSHPTSATLGTCPVLFPGGEETVRNFGIREIEEPP
jgi:hypothetical protein